MWRVRTLDERPELEGAVRSMSSGVLPEFMHHDAGPMACGATCLPGDDGDRVVAAGNSVPLFWDGSLEGLPGGEAVGRSVGDLGAGRAPTVASAALLAMAAPGYRGWGLSGVVLRAIKDVAAGLGLAALISPATLPALAPVERYDRWQREDGLPFDLWLRVHRRLGAGFLRVAPRSMTVTGTVGEWEGWTGMRFPESDPYLVPGDLCPVRMGPKRDLGTYEEPNVWMRHPIEAER